MPKLTKRRVEALKAPEKDVFAWDSELRGFGVRVKPTGSRSYIVQYRNEYGRSRRHTIGQHGHLATEEARTLAKQLLASVARGDDPADERRAMRTVPTVAEFVEQYLADYAQSRKKASTLQTDRTNLRCHILPALASLPITAVTHRDVVKLHQSMSKTPGAANRTLQLLSNIMNVAEKWNLRPELSNPCRHVEKYKLRVRERFLTVAELQRLGVVLRAVERDGTVSSSAIAAIRLLLFTGCRRGEILTLKWDYVDFQERCLRLPD
ncbi:MAG: integrase arm-type DNA-binding domain-containing protein, partial [Alphaproteobacteria bacterium]|nr:integrase arm-type DNA-binding domain-containing protein [Alphaproteobacteria bacterium]